MTRALAAIVRPSTTRGCRDVNAVTPVLGMMNWSPGWYRAGGIGSKTLARNFARIVVRT